MKRTILIIFILLFSFFILKKKDVGIFPNYPIKKVVLGGKTFRLYVADNQMRQSKGLSGLDKMPEDAGMIFIFKNRGFYSFWMKEMNFPLDFVFLDGNLVVYQIENVAPSSFPHTFTADKKFDKAIELNSGTISRLKISQNDKLTLE